MKRWETPLGPFDITTGDHGVSSVRLTNGVDPPRVESTLADALDRHLRGRAASLKLDLQGLSPLAQITLAKLLEIPYGEVRSYSWVSREIGRPNAVRAVASAIANNPVPMLIPCHRVVRSDGHIGDFSLGGPEMKRKLLEFEGVDVERLEMLARHGVRFLGDEGAGVFHVPSCRKGPSADSGSLVELRSVEEAAELRFQPCRYCRPVASFELSESL